MDRIITYKNNEQDPISVRSFLKMHRYPGSVLTYLQHESERVFVDGIETKLNSRLSGGETIEVRLSDPEGSDKIVPTEIPLDILYEDEDILVVNKTAGIPIHSSIAHYTDTLANAVAWYFLNTCEKTAQNPGQTDVRQCAGQDENESKSIEQDMLELNSIEYGESNRNRIKGESIVFRCMNRLDRDTTGVTIICKNRLSAAVLSMDIAARKVHREYAAVVEGITEEKGVIDAPIAREGDSVILRCVDFEKGERAVTCYERENTFARAGKEWSLLKIHLETGRTHQIRVHMNYIGHPIPGDFLYNPDYSWIKRQALHSKSMTFTHPVTGEEMHFEAPIPEDMR